MDSRDPFENMWEDFVSTEFGDIFRSFNSFNIVHAHREIKPLDLINQGRSFNRKDFKQHPVNQRSTLDDPGLSIPLTNESVDTREGSGSVFDRVRGHILRVIHDDNSDNSHSPPQWDVRQLPGSSPGSFRPYLPNDNVNEAETPRRRSFLESYSSWMTGGADGVRPSIKLAEDQVGNQQTTRIVNGDTQEIDDLYDQGGDIFGHHSFSISDNIWFSNHGLNGIFGNFFGSLSRRNEETFGRFFNIDGQSLHSQQSSNNLSSRSEPDISSLYVIEPGK